MTFNLLLTQTYPRQTISTAESLLEATSLYTEAPRFRRSLVVNYQLLVLQQRPNMSNLHLQPRKLLLQAGLSTNQILSVQRLRCFLSLFTKTISQQLTLSIGSTVLTVVRNTLVLNTTTCASSIGQLLTFAILLLLSRKLIALLSRLIVSNTKALPSK